MSELPHNDPGRDARLTAIYRAAEPDAPPAALDAAILAAARREVGARPRPAGFSFARAWRAPLSIAAVIVLSVSLVTLMREESPELTAPPRADAPPAESKLNSSASVDASAPKDAMREEQQSKNVGLKPPQSAPSSGLGMRQPDFMEADTRSKKDTGRLEADTAVPAPLAKRRDAAPADDLRDSKVAASSERLRQQPETQRENAQAPAAASPGKEAAKPARAAEPAAGAQAPFPAAGALAENKTQARQEAGAADRIEPETRIRAQSNYAPAKQAADMASAPATPPPAPVAAMKAAPAQAPAAIQAKPVPPAVTMGKLERDIDLAPDKWLERIEELRKLGRIDDAKASLAEFRKRYPDYRLPDALRDWAKP